MKRVVVETGSLEAERKVEVLRIEVNIFKKRSKE